MSVSLEPATEAAREAFQSLSLSIPIDTSRYQYLCVFLDRVLNLRDERAILRDSDKSVQDTPLASSTVSTDTSSAPEVVPNVVFPSEIWLNDQLGVRDIKIKNSVLQEINSLLEREVANTQSGTPVHIDSNVLSYYEKLLTAYRFLEPPVYQDAVTTSPGAGGARTTMGVAGDYALKEEDDEEPVEPVTPLTTSIARTPSNQSSTNSLSKTYHSLFGASATSLTNGATNTPPSNGTAPSTNGGGSTFSTANVNQTTSPTTNIPAGSRFTRKKRFSTLLGHQPTIEQSNSETPPSESNDDDPKRQQSLNSLLTKSRIYNKIRKNRDSSASSTSIISNPTSISHSNRNSITTTMTSSSKRRGSLQAPYDESRSSIVFGGNTNTTSRHSSMISISGLTIAQRNEIQKNKYEYYVQLKRLLNHVRKVLHVINDSIESRDIINLVEFIKKYVLKFIVIDINEILLEYLELREVSFCRR
ncbi:hypothetical protein CAAN1_14S02894 [[Candida] anglica]|uniref:Uncharacterized protein n=1 Tax=[Candida] anglica TaxID=148631 RepID=A0ABP0EIL7_9ASCO